MIIGQKARMVAQLQPGKRSIKECVDCGIWRSMRHGLERFSRCLEMPGAIVRVTSEQVHSFEQRRFRMKRSRILEDCQRFIKIPIVELELRKLEKTSRER